ncbi:hypothetical protein CI109_102433 [Kwoniella shandongensis]|uniref:Uncharacterized protein n=1 Tax=Kwoniella shandongensis TaxID=1734106 RepID=A0A5M6C584_9TREE|nr:uncharacterized protein CI109_003248 [Kwoniella shandongensis]KAA5528349.1 hypothetical protein CI109_003248 [Kwoniella shandongensis]
MSDSIVKADALVSWLKANGGHFHPSAKLQIDEITGLSAFSTGPIASDERLVSCPFELAVTSGLATQAVCETVAVEEEELVWPAGSSKAGEAWNERMRIGAYLGLHWVYQDKKDSQWPPALAHLTYLDSLPNSSDLTTPLYFSDAELGLLSGSNLLGAVEDRKREWKAESEVVRSVLKQDGLTWDRYLAIATYMSSRSFPSKLLELPDNGGSATHSAGVREVSQPVLLPGVDIFNHARGQPITWLSTLTTSSSGTPTPSISLVTVQVTGANAQLFNNYGAKPNEELLLGYGFVLDSNPDDIVNLRLGTSQIPPAALKRLEAKGLDASKVFELRRDGEVDKGLLDVLRTMLGEDNGEDEVDEEDEHGHHEHETKEMQLEMDVLGMLGGMLDGKLEKLQEGANVEVSEARKEVRQMCEVYRQGQVDILNAAMDKLAERIERIEGLLDEGMGGCPCGC